MKKWKLATPFVLLIILIISCNNQSSSSSTSSFDSTSSNGENIISSSISEDFDFNNLLDDEWGLGKFDPTPNKNRYPNDELYQKIHDKKAVLNAGETYVEDFEKDFLDTRLYVYKSDNNVEYTLQSSGNCRINNTSLCIVSDGNYQGVYFSGMKFARNGTYELSFKYKILLASNDFIIQFRSKSGGIVSDVFATLSGNTGESGTFTHTFDLLDYTDYEIMFFPRNNRGTIALDDITITRMNTKPQIISATIIGEAKVGSILSFEYKYYDAENDVELRTEYRWFTSLDKNGLNKTILNNNKSTLVIDESMRSKYIGLELVPYSLSAHQEMKGKELNVYTSTTVNNERPNIGSDIYLDFNQTFKEDFEKDVNVVGNLLFSAEEGVNSYITMDTSLVIDGNKSLYINTEGSFKGTIFSGVRFARNGIYEIEFKYKFLSKPNNFYIQLRSASAGTSGDKFIDLPLQDLNLNEIYEFKGKFMLDGYNDYYLMMFPSLLGAEIVIDNVKITRLEGYSVEIINKELGVNEKLIEDFDDLTNPKLGIDNTQVPNSKITNDPDLSISGYSLYIESDGSFNTLFINKGIKYVDNATYKVTFDYKILTFVDTIYFQFFSSIQSVYEEFGGVDQVGKVLTFSHEFTINDTSSTIIQIFPGMSQGTTSVIIDNFEIERIK